MNTRASRPRYLVTAVVLAVSALLAVGGAASASSGFPLTLHTADGTIILPERPTRIVSLSPSATQDLYAVGAGRQVVAVDSDSTYPPQAPLTKLSAFTPNAEAIERYKPDLVIVGYDEDHIVAQLRTLHIPVLLEPAVADLSGVYAEIAQIGEATGQSAAAGRAVSHMKGQVAAILRSVGRRAKPLTVYHELDQSYYSATSRTFIGQMYKLLGLRNIADEAPGSSQYPQLSAEYIIASDPDLIVLADTVCCKQSAATVAARPGWDTIAAVKDGGVVPVNDSVASQWGPRIVLFLKTVAAAVRKIELTSK
jgi:iron complex transport system substrate-binding protein